MRFPSFYPLTSKRVFAASLLIIGVVLGVRHFTIREASQLADMVFSSSSTPIPATAEWRVVKRVVDGDTVELETGEKVRYIGINAPESVKPKSPVECFGHEASVYNTGLVEGKRVRLEKDVSDRDRYGRLLRFVYLEDGTFVNDRLVREGYAYASIFPPDVTKADEFKQAQNEARIAHRGLWSLDTCDGKK